MPNGEPATRLLTCGSSLSLKAERWLAPPCLVVLFAAASLPLMNLALVVAVPRLPASSRSPVLFRAERLRLTQDPSARSHREWRQRARRWSGQPRALRADCSVAGRSARAELN